MKLTTSVYLFCLSVCFWLYGIVPEIKLLTDWLIEWRPKFAMDRCQYTCRRCVYGYGRMFAENAVKSDQLPLETVLEQSTESCLLLLRHIPNVFVSLGRHGLLLARRGDIGMHFPTKRFRSVGTRIFFSMLVATDVRFLKRNSSTNSRPQRRRRRHISFIGHNSRTTGVSRYQNVSTLDFVRARMTDVAVTTETIRRAVSQIVTINKPTVIFYRPNQQYQSNEEKNNRILRTLLIVISSGVQGWYLPGDGRTSWSLNFEVYMALVAYIVLLCYGHSISSPSLTLPTNITQLGSSN